MLRYVRRRFTSVSFFPFQNLEIKVNMVFNVHRNHKGKTWGSLGVALRQHNLQRVAADSGKGGSPSRRLVLAVLHQQSRHAELSGGSRVRHSPSPSVLTSLALGSALPLLPVLARHVLGEEGGRVEGGRGHGVLEVEDAGGRTAAPVSVPHVLASEDLFLCVLLQLPD